MNDFTKEELEGILEGLQIIDADPGIRPKIYWEESLKDKIQCMLDNYLEQEIVKMIDEDNKILGELGIFYEGTAE